MGLLPAGDVAAMAAVVNTVSNARLTEIAGPGAPDRYGDTTNSAAVWSGSVPGFLSRHIRDTTDLGGRSIGAAERQSTEMVDTFTILDAAGAPVIEAAGPRWEGSVITIEDRRLPDPTTMTFRVVEMRHDAFGLLDSVALELEAV